MSDTYTHTIYKSEIRTTINILFRKPCNPVPHNAQANKAIHRLTDKYFAAVTQPKAAHTAELKRQLNTSSFVANLHKRKANTKIILPTFQLPFTQHSLLQETSHSQCSHSIHPINQNPQGKQQTKTKSGETSNIKQGK